MSRVLVVDDDPNVVSALAQILIEQGHEVSTAGSGEAVLAFVTQSEADLIVMDIRLPGLSGLETFRELKKAHSKLPVIIMTGFATASGAIEATKLGAFDYHLKPLQPEEILRSISKALECVRLMKRRVELGSDAASAEADAMIGQSPCMREVYKAIGRVAATDASVLIRGETGTGKELVARAIYQNSLRAQAPLIVVNCVTVPDTLFESEFFGFEKGAFTGAEKRRIGKFEQGAGGTLFLDEIGDMPPGLQAKLLRVLQEKTIDRLGGNESIRVDVRILAATNRNLKTEMAKGRFREDLYHRLSVFTIDLPPLRERPEDISGLANYFLGRFARELNIDPPQLAQDALTALESYPWPGNARELQHCIQRAVILTSGYPLSSEVIQRALDSTPPRTFLEADAERQNHLQEFVRDYLKSHRGDNTHTHFLDTAEKLLLSEALRVTHDNQTHAAKLLGLARPTLKAKMDKYGLGRSNR